ncbi:hypothetical protein HEK131_45370 [Streptomyces seoulensis]|nr:hypothetical protein HEK131_45370 [Streptomyces seoulensis]
MLPDLLEAFLGDPAAAGHVLQERDHVVRPFGTAEGEQEEGVIGGGIELVWHDSILPPGTDRGETARGYAGKGGLCGGSPDATGGCIRVT